MEVANINTVVTSKQAILSVCKELTAEQGLQALNMRTVAARCRVSVGSIYNYFPSKADLLAATVQAIWLDILFSVDTTAPSAFPDYVAWMFERMRSGAEAYPDFLTTHALGFAAREKGKGRSQMESCFDRMRAGLSEALEWDTQVRQQAFSLQCPKLEFVDFVLESLLSFLTRGKPSCELLCELIRRSIY